MNLLSSLKRQRFEFPCTVEVEHTQESLHAHLTIDADFEIEPGDEVKVHNPPTLVPFGQRVVAKTTATVVRAGALERAWTRLVGNFELNELYDVSFTERRML